MKNPLEFTILEVDALLHGDAREPQLLAEQHRALNCLVLFIRERQREDHNYQVAKVTEQIRTKETLPRRKVRSEDAEALDSAEIILNMEGGYGESGNVVDVTEHGD